MPGPTPISQLPAGALTGANTDVDNDKMPIDDVSAGVTKYITPKELIANTNSFLASGTGAVARTPQAKAREVLSQDDFSSAANYATALAALATSGQFALGGNLTLGATALEGTPSRLYVVSAGTAAHGISAVANGGGHAILATVNSGNGIAVRASSVGTTQAAIVASATGHHAIDAQQITDLGDALNSESTAYNGIAVYGYAAFLQQGGSPGSPGSSLSRTVTRPAVYCVRDIANLNGFDFTKPVLRVEVTSNTASTTGSLIDAGTAGVTTRVFELMKTGQLVLDQLTDDGELLTLRSTGDVAHGMTSITNTATYGFMGKTSAAGGGLSISGLNDAGNSSALDLSGASETPTDTTKSTAGIGIVNINARRKSGAGVAAPLADSNLLTVQSNGSAKLIVDAEGDAWMTGGLRVGQSGTAAAGVADEVLFYSSDNSAGHTIPSFYTEGTEVLATGQADSASSVRVKMRINGTVVTLLAI